MEKVRKSAIDYILISCCTYCRKRMLAMALWQISKLKLPENIKIELLIIDNSTQHPSKKIVDNFAKNFPLKINYFIEEKRGIAPARNRLLKEAIKLGATHIALFDDDGLIDENWLMSHIESYNNSEAYIISGPQYTWFSDIFPKYIMQNNIFKISSTKEKGEELSSCATNNVFFPLNIIKEHSMYFDEMYVFMGGEDGDFFQRLHNLGYKIIFNPDAIVREITDETRVNPKWVISRSYYNGYSGSLLKFKYEKNKIKKILYTSKLFIVIFIDIFLIPISILRGRKEFLNAICICAKNLGKLFGIIKKKTINYYECMPAN